MIEVSLETIRVGIIGAGSVAGMYHLPVLSAMPDVRIVWICDTNLARARDVAALYGVAEAVDDPKNASDVDAVLLAIPVGYRDHAIDVAFSRHWHVLCEKPFAMTRAAHESILERAGAVGVRTGVMLMRRQYEGNNRLRRIMQERPFGAPRRILASEGNRMRGTGRERDWYQTDVKAAGGGALIETGVHLIDQAFTSCGVTKFRIEAAAAVFDGPIDDEIRARAIVTMTPGEDCVFEVGVSRRNDLYNAVVVEFDAARIEIGTGADGAVTLYDRSGSRLGRLDPPSGLTLSAAIFRAFGLQWRAFLESCRTGATTLSDPGLALSTTAFIEAVYDRIRERAAAVSGSTS